VLISKHEMAGQIKMGKFSGSVAHVGG